MTRGQSCVTFLGLGWGWCESDGRRGGRKEGESVYGRGCEFGGQGVACQADSIAPQLQFDPTYASDRDQREVEN